MSARSRGLWLVLGSAWIFALAAVLVKVGTSLGLPSTTVAFGRFALGALLLSAWFGLRRRNPRPQRWGPVLGRAIGNTLAVVLFYEAIRLSTVTKANLLNMTYPVFVAMAGPWVLREPTSRLRWFALAVALAGIWLVLEPDLGWLGISRADWVGLACGLVSAFAILCLRAARRHDDTETILFWVMGFGAIATAPWAPALAGQSPTALGIWAAAAVLGVFGQFLITLGYRHISAVDGSITSTARIVFAAVLGVALLGEVLHMRLLAGILLVIAALVIVGRHRAAD